MTSQYEPLIQQAIAIVKAGNLPAARALLSKVVMQDPGNARAWYLLSQVVENNEQAIYCLKRVLIIQPDNQLALANEITRRTLSLYEERLKGESSQIITGINFQRAIDLIRNGRQQRVYEIIKLLQSTRPNASIVN